MRKLFHRGIPVLATTIGLTSVTLLSCQPHEGSEQQLTEDIDSFATYYYNWHFEKAVKFCTPESEKWLRYAASNVKQADIDLLHNKPEDAAVSIENIDYPDEKNAIVSISVSNFLQMDTIGKVAHIKESTTIQLPMTLHDGKWKVALSKLP